jgi:hypothetical protein
MRSGLPAEFFDRLEVCKRALSTDGPIRPQGSLYAGMLQNPRCLVVLAEVAAFLVLAEFNVPNEMRASADKAPVAEAAGTATVAEGGGIVHKQRRRADALAAVIDTAKQLATAPNDWTSIWAALVVLAQKPSRPAPLLGYTEGEGVKYQTDNAERPDGWLTRDAFRKRFERAH